jgi:cytochrome P450
LNKAKMDSLPHILEHHVRSFLQHIRRDGSEVDLQPLFFKITMDVASEFLLGQSTDMLSNGGGSATEFVDNYMACSAETVKKMCLGPLSFLRFNSSANQAREKVFEYMDDYIHTSLQSHQQKLQDGQTQRSLFLQDLAAAIGDGKTLRDQFLHIFLASRDTTASLLSNLFFVLAKDPAVYSKLRAEIMSTVGDSSLPTFEQLKRMTYLRWCVNECELPNAEIRSPCLMARTLLMCPS